MNANSRNGINWSHDEVVFALGLYFQIPWGKISQSNPAIIRAARLLGRTPGSLGRKMGNLGRFDPTLAARGVGGLKNGAKMDEIVWNEFVDRREALAAEYERIRSELDDGEPVLEDDQLIKTPPGLEGERLAHYRINQSFFRRSVMSAYNNECCITGINDGRLLIASHIKPWSDCETGEERTKAENGLCLNSLHDRAFDKGLITLDEDLRVVNSMSLRDAVKRDVYETFFGCYEGVSIHLPVRARPSPEFLDYHRNNIFMA